MRPAAGAAKKRRLSLINIGSKTSAYKIKLVFLKRPEEVGVNVEELAADGVAKGRPHDGHGVEDPQVEGRGLGADVLVDVGHAWDNR